MPAIFPGARILKLPVVNASLRRLLTYLMPYKWTIVLAFIFTMAAGASSSLIASLLGKLMDIGFYNQAAWIIIAAPVGLILISFLHGGSMFLSAYLLRRVSQNVLMKLREEIFHKFLRWPAATYQANPTGLISSKFVFEANVALTRAAKTTLILVRDSCQVVFLTGVLIWHDWILALVTFVIAPMVYMLLRYISNKMRSVMSSCQTSLAGVLVQVKEVYESHRLVKISNTYDFENRRFGKINDDVRKMMVDMTKVTSVGVPLTQFICMTGVAVVLTFALYQTRAGHLTMGDFVTFLAAQLLLMPPLKNLTSVNSGLVMMTVAAESIFKTIDEKEEEDTGTETLENCRGEVVFDHVSLRYPKTDRDAVKDFHLTVKPGDCIALVGFSGSGKSSLVNLLPRFWTPTAGRILIDGKDIRTITLESLRRNIAIVSQEVVLFDDTIRNNIAYGTPDATDEDIARAVEAAALTDFIASLPQGLETPVGEAGNRLSGGQKQRISIARALLKNAPILILDEATSALDSESEAHIKDALAYLMKGRTTFIVAHRLSTIENATLIVAMSEGVVEEMGTRAELLAKDGLYANLCRLQTLHTEEGKSC
ncbi:MAG: lipid A export permease/ATP-binding protein MsbA [Duodenibacillus sp.]|nr:lipid A export permease/ATP-binding protein MsbA [Duodenibacillus sp.]